MKTIIKILRALPKKGQSNITKIVSLAIGLSVGLVLISKVFFEQSYDNFYPQVERIYQVHTSFTKGDDPASESGRVSGAIAPGIKAESPSVEVATRYTYIAGGDNSTFTDTDTKKRYNGSAIVADSCLFDILPRPMITGDAKETLSRPMYALVSKSIADKIGGNVIDKTIELDMYPGRILTVGGVFEDIPENSHEQYNIIISMPSLGKFTWDGKNNWVGNDRYCSYLKLNPNTDMAALTVAIRTMQEKNQPLEEFEKSNLDMRYVLSPLSSLHSGTPETKRMTLLLTLLATVLIAVSVMNYVLIVTSSLVGRSKEIAVHKCYGAGKKEIAKIIFTEIFVHLMLALILAAIIILLFSGIIEGVLNTSMTGLFSLQTCMLLGGVCLLILLVTGLIPSYLFSKIPVASAIKNFKVSNRVWRLGLLFVQIVSVFFLSMLVILIEKQYDLMVNDKPGYSYEKVVYCDLTGTPLVEREKIANILESTPAVEMVASSNELPFAGMSGNNVRLSEQGEDLFNIADFRRVSHNYLNLMNISVVEGKGFSKESTKEALVSKRFADKISNMLGWTDGIIGKDVYVTGEHGVVTIVGVYNDFRLGSITNEDTRSSALFSGTETQNILSIKLNQMNPESIAIIDNIIQEVFPGKDKHPNIYSDNMIRIYNDSLQFRNSVLVGGIVTLLIALIGLIGYLRNEVVRRSKEIAIRKVNGATLGQVVSLFIKDILILCIPAILIGEAGAAMTASKWMEDFSLKYQFSPMIFIGCTVFLLIAILGIVAFYCTRVANSNPVDTLQND